MKPVFWLLLGIVAVAVSCGPVVADFATYQGEVGGLNLSVQYPTDWQVEETAAGITIRERDGGTETAVSGSVTIETIPISVLAVDNLTQLMAQELDTLRAQRQITLREDIVETSVNGRDAVTAVLDAGDGVVLHYTIIRTETTLALALGQIDAAAEESAVNQIEEIINSVEVSAVTQ